MITPRRSDCMATVTSSVCMTLQLYTYTYDTDRFIRRLRTSTGACTDGTHKHTKTIYTLAGCMLLHEKHQVNRYLSQRRKLSQRQFFFLTAAQIHGRKAKIVRFSMLKRYFNPQTDVCMHIIIATHPLYVHVTTCTRSGSA